MGMRQERNQKPQRPRENTKHVEYFPRSFEHNPQHSPLFWAENKDRFLRQLLIRDIERITRRRLCVYFSSPYIDTSLYWEDIPRLYEVVNADGNTPFDLLLESPGGYTDAAEALISMLRKINPDFRVIVPLRAKSNATLICLASRKILMGAPSELGPLEPSINGIPVSILQEQENKEKDFDLWRLASDALKQTESLATEYLRVGMMASNTDEERKDVVDALCTRAKFHSHGSVIDYDQAKSLKLGVEKAEDSLWKRVWLLHSIYARDSDAHGIGKFFEGRVNSRVIAGRDPKVENGDGA
jgi:Serine dehydrogenase proteinase